MRFAYVVLLTVFVVLPWSARAQCFNRAICADPSMLEVRSQISIAVPVADQALASDTMKAMEDARRHLYALSNRECDTLKATFGGDCALSAIDINSSIQDRGLRNKTAFVSISTTYDVKKAPVK